jgi:hypothetical protein
MRSTEAFAEAARRRRRGRRRLIPNRIRRASINSFHAGCDRLNEKTEFDRLSQDCGRGNVVAKGARGKNDEASLGIRNAAAHPIRASTGQIHIEKYCVMRVGGQMRLGFIGCPGYID